MSTHTETIYVAPGNSQCRVYAIPHGMRPGQKPSDLLPSFQESWAEIGLLNFELKLVCIDPEYAHLRDDITGQMGGTFFEVQMSGPASNFKPRSTVPF